MQSRSQDRRIRFQLAEKTTEELIRTRDRLLLQERDTFQNQLLEMIESILSKRSDFLPVK